MLTEASEELSGQVTVLSSATVCVCRVLFPRHHFLGEALTSSLHSLLAHHQAVVLLSL